MFNYHILVTNNKFKYYIFTRIIIYICNVTVMVANDNLYYLLKLLSFITFAIMTINFKENIDTSKIQKLLEQPRLFDPTNNNKEKDDLASLLKTSIPEPTNKEKNMNVMQDLCKVAFATLQ